MKRRSFLRTLALGTVSLPIISWPRLSLAQAADRHPPFAATVPETPFDGPSGGWTLAVLPDTQNYARKFPEVYDRQCQWIVENQKRYNILFVAHEGDITDGNTPPEWENARRSMSILNRAGIPYSLVPGNHDTGPSQDRCKDRSTLLNDYFSKSDFAASVKHGLFEPGKLQNNWHHLDAPTGKYIIVGLEYGPRDVVIDWAKSILAENSDRQAILLTHCYLYSDSTRYDESKYGKGQKWSPKESPGLIADGNVNDAEDIWSKLVAPSKNVILVLSGHVLNNGTGYLTSAAHDRHSVHQILANYQATVEIDDGAGGIPYAERAPGTKKTARAFGGGGFLRLLQFSPNGGSISVKTYSPWYDRWLTHSDQQFAVILERQSGSSIMPESEPA